MFFLKYIYKSSLLYFFSLFSLFFHEMTLNANWTPEPIDIDGKIDDDERIAQLITIITFAYPFSGLPDPSSIYNTRVSLLQNPALAKCAKIIVFDGVEPKYENRKKDYDLYKIFIAQFILNDPHFKHTKMLFCNEWQGQAGAIRLALKDVSTPYIFIHHYNSHLNKNFDLNGLIATMECNPIIKHVRLNELINGTCQPEFNGVTDEQISGTTFVPLCRTFGWSDEDHISRTSYYKNFVLPQCFKGNLSLYMHGFFRDGLVTCGLNDDHSLNWDGINAIHAVFGTFFYGDLKDGEYILKTR